jgi:prophage regulatory protein
MDPTDRLLRQPPSGGILGLPPASFYEQIKQGLIPPGIKIGPRRVAWLESEIRAILAARVAGSTDAQIRALVKRLIRARKGDQ